MMSRRLQGIMRRAGISLRTTRRVRGAEIMEDKEIIEANKHISDATIQQDISDTMTEIRELKDKIDKREAFIEKLRYLWALRYPKSG